MDRMIGSRIGHDLAIAGAIIGVLVFAKVIRKHSSDNDCQADKTLLRKFRLPMMIGMAISLVSFVCKSLDGIGPLVVAFSVLFALATSGVALIGATLLALSLVCVVRHKRWSLFVDTCIGGGGVVFVVVIAIARQLQIVMSN